MSEYISPWQNIKQDLQTVGVIITCLFNLVMTNVIDSRSFFGPSFGASLELLWTILDYNSQPRGNVSIDFPHQSLAPSPTTQPTFPLIATNNIVVCILRNYGRVSIDPLIKESSHLDYS